MTEPARNGDVLAELRARLEETRAAAEQHAGEAAGAARAAAAGDEPPPGWRTPGERDQVRDDAAALTDLLQTLAQIIPPELRAQLAEVLRQILLLLRALIDWVVEQLPHARGDERAVRDIPLS